MLPYFILFFCHILGAKSPDYKGFCCASAFSPLPSVSLLYNESKNHNGMEEGVGN
jgi:hypothetical protein